MTSPRLLVVDDEPEWRAQITRTARTLGYEVAEASNRSEFLATLDDAPADAIILDLRMPDADGIELMQMLAERGHPAQLVIASGLGQRLVDAAGRLARERGLTIAATLTKPVRLADLRRVLTDLRGEPSAAGARPLMLPVTLLSRFLAAPGTLTGVEIMGAPELSGREAADAALRRAADLSGDTRLSALMLRAPPDLCASTLEADRLTARLGELGLDPQRIVLAVDHALLLGGRQNARILGRLRTRGLRIALVEFGVHPLDLPRLAAAPVDEAHLAAPLILGAQEGGRGAQLLRAVLALAHELGLVTVAHGVDSAPLRILADQAGIAECVGTAGPSPLSA